MEAPALVVLVGTDSPPTLLIHGQRDSMVNPLHSDRLGEALEAAGVPHHVLRLPWFEHGGDATLLGPSGRVGLWAIEAFVDSVLAGEVRT